MFRSRRAYKKLEWQLSDTQCSLDNYKNDLQNAQNREKDLREQLSSSESLVKGLQQQIRALTNTANARLSALIGMQRYLASFFDDTNNPEEPTEKAQDNPNNARRMPIDPTITFKNNLKPTD